MKEGFYDISYTLKEYKEFMNNFVPYYLIPKQKQTNSLKKGTHMVNKHVKMSAASLVIWEMQMKTQKTTKHTLEW